MNKKLLALALTSAFALPMAGQAETTLYGQFNLSYDSMNMGTDVGAVPGRALIPAQTFTDSNGVTHTIPAQPAVPATPARSHNFNGLVSNNSRLGVKGIEALGGGLNAVYQVESRLDATTGSSNGVLASRNTFAGLNNATFGTFWAGRNDTPYKRATGTWDFFNETIGDMNNVISNPTGSGAAAAYGTYHDRTNRSLGYDGAWHGAYLDLQAGTQDPVSGGVVGNTPKFSKLSGLVGYRFAGFDVNYSIEQNRALGGTTAVNGIQAPFFKAKGQQIGVAYTLPAQYNAVQLAAVYEKLDSDAANVGSQKNWWVGAAVPFLSNNKFGISYGKAGSISGVNGGDNGAKLAAIGASHNFTKNTSLYAVYARVKNDTNGTYGLNVDHGDVSNEYNPVGPTSVGGAVGGGQTVKGVSIGLLTKF